MERFLTSEAGAEVLVGRGIPRGLPERPDRERVAILTQPGPAARVAADVAGHLHLPTDVIELPDRESAKELAAVGDVYDRLAEINLGRHDTIVGVGGGALTDVAGFVAATWLRGVESVLVPTTVLGAVDAAIGGKTGINRRGKNLVGAFWHPTRVIVDLDVLDTVPAPLRLEGDAEIIKAGFIAAPSIIEEYERHGSETPLDLVVPAAIAVKAEVVREDFREGGRRAILNFGHTVGHAVEIQTQLPHGFAVSVGMVAEAEISRHRYGFDAARLADLLFSVGLPVAAAGVSGRAAMDLIARDKKRSAEGIRMVLLSAPYEPRVEVVTPDELQAALAAVGAV